MDAVTERLIGFVMILTRLSAFFLVVPIFGSKGIPNTIKVTILVVLAAFFSITIPLPGGHTARVLEVLLLLSNEAVYGLALGLITAIVFGTVRAACEIVEQQMGLSMAQVLDPLSGEMAQPLGMLMEMIFIVLFLNVNGHHLFLRTVAKSYEAFPAGTLPSLGGLTQGVLQAGSVLLTEGLQMAAPILAAFLLLMVLLAVIARVSPETNILFMSLPLQMGLGLLLTAGMIPFVSDFVGRFAEWMGKLLPV